MNIFKIIFSLFLLLAKMNPVVYADNMEFPLKYNFEYWIQVNTRGRILWIIPYRFYYEASASINFISKKKTSDGYKFYFDSINKPGYVIATGGLTGSSVYFFTADYDLKRSARFLKKKLELFYQDNPYFAKRIKKVRRRPMLILSSNKEAVSFLRASGGIHHDINMQLKLTASHSNTYSNIYKILAVMLKFYNHSWLPPYEKADIKYFLTEPDKVWKSISLDFTEIFKQFARLSSEGARKHARIKQERMFSLDYSVSILDESIIEIVGESRPLVTIMNNFKIRKITRRIMVRKNDGLVLSDCLEIDFRQEKIKGGLISLSWELK